MLNFLNSIHIHGLLYIVALFYPVYWKQDSHFHNGGNDVISLHNKSGSYLYGTLTFPQLKQVGFSGYALRIRTR
jgi:hypothetical protein